jgi:hypothetical protein
MRERHPSRIAAIWIRRVNRNPERARFAGQGDLSSQLPIGI